MRPVFFPAPSPELVPLAEDYVRDAAQNGVLDFPGFFRSVAANGYSGWCVVEQDIKFGVSPVAPKESMGASLKFLRKVVAPPA